MAPRLSVILPFYDETAFVRAAVASVRAQGIDGCEIVVVNDNPERFGEADLQRLGLGDDVRLLSHDRNRGLSAARNTGIAGSSGAVIGFLDSDDYYVTNGLAQHLALAELSGADMVHAQTYLAHGVSPQLTPLPRDEALFGQKVMLPRPLIRMEQAQFITSSWSSLYRRDFLDRCALRFDVEQTRFEDRLFVLQSVTAADRIACLGAPVRVWRRRAGSISTSAADLPTFRLQVKLLEKCLTHMRGAVAAGLPARFYKREVFNTVSRLIWDMDLLDQLILNPGDELADLAQRVVRLLGTDSFHADFLDDPVIRKISRVALPSRRGRIDRRNFLALHAALRAGDFAKVGTLLPARQISAEVADATSRRAARPARPAPAMPQLDRVILHLGMHKTGSTYVQHQLCAHRGRLLRQGVLLPETGLDPEDRPATRPGGFAGHIGLLAGASDPKGEVWSDLAEETRRSGAQAMVISCENMLMPFDPDRPGRIAAVMAQLSRFGPVHPVALVRRPDRAIEALWREIVGNGRRAGARSLPEFLVDHATTLTDLPALFAPFEQAAGRQVRLGDFDAAKGAVWPLLLGLCGINGTDLPEDPAAPRYATPTASQILLARIADAMIPTEPLRIDVLQALFRTAPAGTPDRSLLPPADRLGLIDRFIARSQDWAAERGYAPEVAAWQAELAGESWHPPDPPDAAALESLITARLLAERPPLRSPAPTKADQAPSADPADPADPARSAPGLTIRVRPRPWVVKLLGQVGKLRKGSVRGL